MVAATFPAALRTSGQKPLVDITTRGQSRHLDLLSAQDKTDILVEHVKRICPIRNTLRGVTVKSAN